MALEKDLLQNAVFRPKREICVLKKLARTAALTVLANFFFDLIFRNSILQQALFELVVLNLLLSKFTFSNYQTFYGLKAT